jgi:glycosyltransferase involved in cell wall biosynthesis
MHYSLIIPIYNEADLLENLLFELKEFSINNQIIIVNDGSSDKTEEILAKYSFVVGINLNKNFGKGVAIRIGLSKAKYEKVIIYDGDMELRTKDIDKLMKLNKKHNIRFMMGYRSSDKSIFNSYFDLGNILFTFFFNVIYKTTHKDILCCAKSFYKDDLCKKILISKGFDIDIEMTSILTRSTYGSIVPQVPILYKRRSFIQGKKLNILDGWTILKRMILS